MLRMITMDKPRIIINGDVIYNPSKDYSNVEKITGSLYCRGADTKASFPKLAKTGQGLTSINPMLKIVIAYQYLNFPTGT